MDDMTEDHEDFTHKFDQNSAHPTSFPTSGKASRAGDYFVLTELVKDRHILYKV
eukprot:m.235388 g.235388  ORF g.235388 m.235388 type:complete len:54 (-) comp16045_c0_seq1:336-497(-)